MLLRERRIDHEPVRRLVWVLGRALAVGVQVQLERRRLGAGRVDDELEPPRGQGKLANRSGDYSAVLSHCRDKQDLLGFAAALIQSAK